MIYLAIKSPLRNVKRLTTTNWKSVAFASTVMAGNRAAFLEEAKGKFVVQDAPIEQPGPGEVLVKVHVSQTLHADT